MCRFSSLLTGGPRAREREKEAAVRSGLLLGLSCGYRRLAFARASSYFPKSHNWPASTIHCENKMKRRTLLAVLLICLLSVSAIAIPDNQATPQPKRIS